MAHTLENEFLTLTIDLPEEQYQLARFDWTGKIPQVTYRGIPLTSQELPGANTKDIGQGLYNEFGFKQPVGFDEVQEGDWFHKIGVGLLQKKGTVYDFKTPYRIRPADFEIKTATEKATLWCQGNKQNGYGYLLKKVIQLKGNTFSIHYQLTNTGDKPIYTTEYTHNFMAIGQQQIGPSYLLKLPFQTAPDLFEETVNPEGLVIVGSKNFRLSGEPKAPFFFSNLSGGKAVKAKWILENQKAQLGISETGDFKTSWVNLWGWGHVISPELFHQIDVGTNETIEWTRTYRVYEL